MQLDVDGVPIFVSDDIPTTTAQLRAQADNAFTESQNLRAYLDGFSDAWQFSGAAALYEDLRLQWDQSARALFGEDGLMGAITNALDVSYRNYVDAEHNNHQTWQH